MKKSLKVAFSILLAFTFIYKYLNLSFFSSVIIVLCVLILSSLKFNYTKNHWYYKGLLITAFLVLCYSCIHTARGKIIDDWIKELNFSFYIKSFTYILFPIIYSLTVKNTINCFTSNACCKPTLPELYYERKQDLERLNDAFNKFGLIGVVGEWGSGKTFLTKYLEENVKEKANTDWQFIRINLLSCKLDKVEIIIIDEIENILERYSIASIHTRSLKSILGSSNILNSIYSAIFPSELYGKAIENLKRQLVKNNIHVAIVIEDIDRVDNSIAVDKLISITNVLENEASKNIKIIYEYNYSKLVALNTKFDREFLDKYIECEVFVTPIKLEKLVNELIKIHNYNYFDANDFIFLKLPAKINEINSRFNINIECNWDTYDYPVRAVEHFLMSIDNYMSYLFPDNKDKKEQKDYLTVVIVFYFIKFFDHEFYRKLEHFNNVNDSFYLLESPNNGKDYIKTTFQKLITEYYNSRPNKKDDNNADRKKCLDRIKTILLDPINAKSYKYAALLQYNIFSFSDGRSMYFSNNNELYNIAHNENVDSLFRNMLWNGRNPAPDIKLLLQNLDKEVFSIPDTSKWLKRFYIFVKKNNDNYYQFNQGSEHTMFLIGIHELVTTFQCMSMQVYNKQDWYNLVTLLFLDIEYSVKLSKESSNNRKGVNWSVLNRCLSYVNYRESRVLRLVLEKYAKIEPGCSFIDDNKYWVFLLNILETLYAFGGKEAISYDLRLLRNYVYTLDGRVRKDEVINTTLQPLLDYLQDTIDQQEEYDIPSRVINDLSLYVDFLKNNIDILKHDKVFKEPNPIEITIKDTKDTRSDTINAIVSDKKINNRNELDSIIKNKLKDGSLSVLDIKIIQKSRKDIYEKL